MLTTLHLLLKKAARGHFAIPAFNVTNLETAQAVIRAAQAAHSPVIIQTSESAIEYAGHLTLLGIMESLARSVDVPVVTHLDHGKHSTIVRSCIRSGYRSVHMDASEQSYRTNMKQTAAAVALGHNKGITVQGELGYLLGYEGMMNAKITRAGLEKLMTDPRQAAHFVKETKVDTLAIAVGTAHGSFKGREFIDLERVSAIARATRKPLVLHGGSGVTDAEIKKGIRRGIRIINVDTTLRLAYMNGLVAKVRFYDPKKKVDIREFSGAARDAMQREAIRLMRLFGSAGHA